MEKAVEKQILPASAKHSNHSMAKVLYQTQFIKPDHKFDDCILEEEQEIVAPLNELQEKLPFEERIKHNPQIASIRDFTGSQIDNY